METTQLRGPDGRFVKAKPVHHQTPPRDERGRFIKASGTGTLDGVLALLENNRNAAPRLASDAKIPLQGSTVLSKPVTELVYETERSSGTIYDPAYRQSVAYNPPRRSFLRRVFSFGGRS